MNGPRDRIALSSLRRSQLLRSAMPSRGPFSTTHLTPACHQNVAKQQHRKNSVFECDDLATSAVAPV
jgi:hypothetical protein